MNFNAITQTPSFLQDFLRCCCPRKWFRVAIILLDELLDLGHQVFHAGKAAAPNGPFGYESEPSFNLIEP